MVTLCGTVAVLSVQQRFGGWGSNGIQRSGGGGGVSSGSGVQGGSCSPTSLPSPPSSRPSSVEKIDSYTLVPHMSSPKCATGTGNLGGQLLVCGGYDRGECLRTVEAYNHHTNTWSPCPSMRQGRGRFDLTVLGDRAYAVGGCDGVKELATVEVLDRAGDRWESAAPLPLARSNTGELPQPWAPKTPLPAHLSILPCCFPGKLSSPNTHHHHPSSIHPLLLT